MNNLDILYRAVDELNDRLTNEKAKVCVDDNTVTLTLMGKQFWCIIVPNLTVGWILTQTPMRPANIPDDVQILYVTINATSKIMDFSKMSEVNILDCAGNFKIQYHHKNGDLFFMLANRGETPVADINPPNTYPIFKEAGIKVIFYFLLDKSNIGKRFRDIQEATGVSIGTVKNIIDGMVYQNFARVEGRKRFLSNIDRLLMLWSANYGQNLKPKLFLTRMTFRDNDVRNEWQRLGLPEGMYWGGEAAAALTNGYMNPGEFIVYTEVAAPMIMKTGVVKPDKNGDIIIYKRFWIDNCNNLTAPAVLTYADLMDTGNGRCIETAQKMKENELAYLF